jgi:hypothetical protein
MASLKSTAQSCRRGGYTAIALIVVLVGATVSTAFAASDNHFQPKPQSSTQSLDCNPGDHDGVGGFKVYERIHNETVEEQGEPKAYYPPITASLSQARFSNWTKLLFLYSSLWRIGR